MTSFFLFLIHTSYLLLFFAKCFSIASRNFLAVVTFSDTEPLKVLELLSVRAVGCSILGTRSRSIQPRTIIAFSFKSLKLVSFSIGMELMLADMVEADVLAEQRTKNILRRTMSSFFNDRREEINMQRSAMSVCRRTGYIKRQYQNLKSQFLDLHNCNFFFRFCFNLLFLGIIRHPVSTHLFLTVSILDLIANISI